MTHQQNQHRNRETSKAMSRIAVNRQCPKCLRKMALVFHSDEYAFGHHCRWQDCDYNAVKPREARA